MFVLEEWVVPLPVLPTTVSRAEDLVASGVLSEVLLVATAVATPERRRRAPERRSLCMALGSGELPESIMLVDAVDSHSVLRGGKVGPAEARVVAPTVLLLLFVGVASKLVVALAGGTSTLIVEVGRDAALMIMSNVFP